VESLPDVGELALILCAIAVGSFIKGVTGSGLPQIAIPVIAVFLGVERAVVIMALPGVVTNTLMMWEHRASARQTRDLPVLVTMGVIGSVIGTIGLATLDPALLSLALAGVGALYVALFLSRYELRMPVRLSRLVSPPLGLVAGMLQGSTGISGPLLTTYLHAFRLPRSPFIFSLVTLFNVLAVAQVAALVRVDLYTPERLFESLLAVLPMLVFLPLGARFSARLSQQRFDRALVALVSASAVLLAWEGINGLLG